MRYWCEQAWLGELTDHVVLTVSGDRIESVESGVTTAPGDAMRLAGLTLPGFANAHSHAFHRALRGRTHRAGGTFWEWRDGMYTLAAALDPDTYEALATATFAEMVLAGYTCVGEFHYLHHGPDGATYDDANEVGRRLLAAAARAGIRITLLDTLYLHSGLAADGTGSQPDGAQRRFSDGSAYRWAERVEALTADVATAAAFPGQRVGAAIHSVRAADRHAIAVAAEWARAREVPLHAHVSEQPRENAECVQAYGLSPLELLDSAGALSASFTAVHATHASAGDLQHLASGGSNCCLCPTTERELADGIGPTAAMRALGVGLCVGSDSHAVIDPFEELRAVELDERLDSLQRGTHRPHELLAAGTANGYASLGWSDGGRLAPGALADLVTVSYSSPRLAGADRADPLGAVVFAAAAGDVTDVVIGGEHVVADGVHRGLDVIAALDASINAAWDVIE